MPAPITTDGPHDTRRHKRKRWVLLALFGTLFGMPFLTASVVAFLKG